MLDSNKAIYLERSPLGPGWYACEIVGNRILYTGPLRSREEALHETKKNKKIDSASPGSEEKIYLAPRDEPDRDQSGPRADDEPTLF